MHGIKKLTMYSRKVAFVEESRLDLSAPSMSQSFQTLEPSTDGDDGKHGVDGPTGMARGVERGKWAWRVWYGGGTGGDGLVARGVVRVLGIKGVVRIAVLALARG